MKNKDFAHLHVHNEHSLLDGYGTAKQYVTRAKALGFEYLALTNHGNVDGCLKFQQECDSQGLSPILGAELYIVPDATIRKKGEKKGHIVILVKNQTGWEQLCALITRSNLEGFYSRPRVDYEMILNCDLSGWIIMTACVGSFLNQQKSEDFFLELIDRNRHNLYFEIMPHEADIQKDYHEKWWGLISDFSLVATNDCHYIDPEDNQVQDVLLCIQRNKTWKDENRWTFDFRSLYLRTADEMVDAFKKQNQFNRADYLRAMRNTIKIAKQCCDFRIKEKKPALPIPPSYDKKDILWIELGYLIDKGLEEKNFLDNEQYVDRANQESKIIRSKNFETYFFIVKDLIDWCIENNIMVGPGRGSVGGCLIAYLLGITQIDPIKYNLSFSRFISEDRIDLPDIDLDFEKVKRHLVKKYLTETYGENYVASISTFGKLHGRGAVRDVGRVFELPNKEVESLINVIPYSNPEKVGKYIKETQQGQSFSNQYSKEAIFIEKLDGQIRSQGQHAAAVVLSAEDLTNGKRCTLRKGKEDETIINWDMEDCEHQGLVKLDVLGLSTLSVLNYARNLIQNRDAIKLKKEKILYNFNFDQIEFDDEAIFELISSGKTSGIFQLTGTASSIVISDMGINCFEDIIATMALARPGPSKSGMTKEFIKRKQKGNWPRKHKIYEKITNSTYGILVYQEQVMQVISQVAGLSESTADKIRKVIGKKRDAKEFEPYHKQFKEGCQKLQTLSPEEAEDFWEGLIEWAGYGFNRCLVGDTLLTRSSFNQYTGKHISIEDLYLKWHEKSPVGDKYRSQGLDIMQMSEDKRCRPGKIIGIYYQGKKTIVKITTQTGKSVKATLNHRLYTFDGYKRIDKLKIGDRLACMGSYQESITEKKGQKWKKTNNKGKKGFQKEKNNPAYIDGRTKYLEKAKKIALIRSDEKCEQCGLTRENRFEFAHLKTLDESNNDYQKYHSAENILYLCNSCHKQLDYELGTRRKRYSKGYPIYYDPIVSMEFSKEQDVFDIEMLGPNHNFVANGIISHNSHSVGYAIIAYWTAWLKKYYPAEFYCALLTYGEFDSNKSDKSKQRVIDEILSTGFKIISPKISKSDPCRWVAEGQILYMPFTEIKGIGEKMAKKHCGLDKAPKKKKRKGFFPDLQPTIKPDNKVKEIMAEISADNLNAVPDDIDKYLEFNLGGAHPEQIYPNMIRLLKFNTNMETIEAACKLEVGKYGFFPPGIIQRKRSHANDVVSCEECKLTNECISPVVTSTGLLNIFIVGEGPGPEEDKHQISFYDGKNNAGHMLWKEIAKYGYNRRTFHVSNVTHCYPGKIKKLNETHVDTCFPLWTLPEIRVTKCRLVLGIGNMCLYAFTGKKTGIKKLSGTTEWIEKLGLWICWCIHPAAVLRNKSNREPFEKGIKNFIEKMEVL